VKPEPDLVSVITRTRDRPELLEEAMASVAAQDYPAIEHLVVNDGGADVRAIVEKPRSHVRPRYFAPGEVGRCRAGNIALEASKGRWIAWLDDDDLYYPHHVSTLVKALQECGKLVVYSDADHVLQSFDPATKKYRDVSRTPTPSFEWSKITLWRRGDLHLVTVMHDRKCFDRLGGLDETIPVLEDLDLLSRFAQDYDFHHVPKVTAVFRVRDDNTNAVTALRDDFVRVRTIFYTRYAHLVMPELLGMVEHGAEDLAVMKRRIEALEEEVRRLREGRGR
jgi:glycosyltransferase involved in cell wall biosynthesis